MSEPLIRALRPHLNSEPTVVGSAREFLAQEREAKAVAFIDNRAVEALVGDGIDPPVPTVAVCDDSLQTAVSWLPSRTWLSHVVGASLLNSPRFKEHLDSVT